MEASKKAFFPMGGGLGNSIPKLTDPEKLGTIALDKESLIALPLLSNVSLKLDQEQQHVYHNKYEKKYKGLAFLKEKNIFCAYTPFTQGATINIFDESWLGSCNILSYTWMLKKTEAENIAFPSCYEINNPLLPHPLIIGYNEDSQDDIKNIIKKMKDYSLLHSNQYNITQDFPCESESAEGSLANFINSKDPHYGLITTSMIFEKDDIIANDFLYPRGSIGHQISFAKRGDIISFFDPNYGEITFNNFQDFKIWFLEETKEYGSLAYICAKKEISNSEKYLIDYFPIPIFEQKKDVEDLSKKIIDIMQVKREIRKKIKVKFIPMYSIKSYFHGIGSPVSTAILWG